MERFNIILQKTNKLFLTYVPLDELISFYRKQFLRCLKKNKKVAGLCIVSFKVFALNRRSIKIPLLSVVKILLKAITYATY